MSRETSSRHAIGLVGVGRMGMAFAHRLRGAVRHGEGDKDSTVIVEDIRRRVVRPAAAQGGRRT